eukprot:2733046-Amphidinium_carterae.1
MNKNSELANCVTVDAKKELEQSHFSGCSACRVKTSKSRHALLQAQSNKLSTSPYSGLLLGGQPGSRRTVRLYSQSQK